MNSTIIKPTIGRVVWFHPSEFTGEAGFAGHGNDQPYAAIIAHVWSDAMVNLTVFDANGTAHSRTSVALVQDGSPVPGGGFYCEWMPYQKNQAAKAEAAQATEPVGHPIPTQRDQLEYVLVSGAAGRLAEAPHEAAGIAAGIKNVLNALRPTNVKIDATTITLPVVDPGPGSLEREIQAKADATPRWAQCQAPRVTMDMVNAQIVGETYTVLPSGRVTVCELTLANGFTVRGESAVVFIENNVQQTGREIARKNAVDQIWQLLGFRLRDELARPVLTEADAAADLAGTPRPDNHIA